MSKYDYAKCNGCQAVGTILPATGGTIEARINARHMFVADAKDAAIVCVRCRSHDVEGVTPGSHARHGRTP